MNIAPIGTDLGCTLRCRNWSDSQLRHFIKGMEYFLVAIGITEFSLKIKSSPHFFTSSNEIGTSNTCSTEKQLKFTP